MRSPPPKRDADGRDDGNAAGAVPPRSEEDLRDRSETLSDRNRTLSDQDQTLSDRDQEAADEDQAAADNAHEHGVDDPSYEQTAAKRQGTSHERLVVGALRDETQGLRDKASQEEDEHGHTLGLDAFLTGAARTRKRARDDRERAATDREHAASDRSNDAAERARAAEGKHAA
jgi:hypothetical protein